MSKLPSLAVAVWALGPSFVQVIVSPTCTVIELGLNWKSEIVTPVSVAAWARCGALARVGAYAEAEGNLVRGAIVR